MKTKTLALLAGLTSFVAFLAPMGASASSDAALRVYYSFEIAPQPEVLDQMQAELARILSPSDLRVEWRDLRDRETEGADYRDLVVVHFRGGCSTGLVDGDETAGARLGETDIVDGRVIPFGEVECDELRRFIGFGRESAVIGRALARVTAHEIYHMLTGSASHARRGIARAEHSRAELTAATFDFAPAEQDWLRAWAERRVQPSLALALPVKR